MFEHESHLIATAIDPRHAQLEGGHQVVECVVEHVRQDGAFEMSPQSLDQIETRTVWRQPIDSDLPAVLMQPLTYSLSVMKPAVVANQSDLATRISSQQCDQEYDEVGSRLRWGDRVGDPTGGVIDATIDHSLLVLSRCRNLRLRSDRCPDPTKGWMPMNFHFVLIDQDFRSVGTGRFFFYYSSYTAAC